MNNIQEFVYENTPIRMIENNGETWWVLKDICKNHKMTKIKRSKIMSKCYLCESTENVLKVKDEYLCESCRNHIVLRSLIFKEKRQSRLKAYIIGILGTLSAFGFKLFTYLIN